MHVGHANPNHTYTVINEIEEINIQECDEEKDLGVLFDKSPKFDKHVSDIETTADKIVGIIKRSFGFNMVFSIRVVTSIC